MSKIIDALGGRKAVALWAAIGVAGAMLAVCLGGWVHVPADQQPILDKAIDLLKWSLGIFTAGNVANTVTALIRSSPLPTETPSAPASPAVEADPAPSPPSAGPAPPGPAPGLRG